MKILLWCDDLLTRTRLESAWKAAGASEVSTRGAIADRILAKLRGGD